MAMLFEWDSRKSATNLRKHGLAFADAAQVFAGVVITATDERKDYGELRYQSLGLLQARVVLIVHTRRENHIRVISMRKANEKESRLYFQQLEKAGLNVGARH